MQEKSFLVDVRSRAPGKLHEQAIMIIEEMKKGTTIRIHIPDMKRAEEFDKILKEELIKQGMI